MKNFINFVVKQPNVGFKNTTRKKRGQQNGENHMNKNLEKIILTLTDWNKDGKTQWWEPLLSLLFIIMFWVGMAGAVIFALWLGK